jgi:NIMA (never in mitosis gene a)-related kinase
MSEEDLSGKVIEGYHVTKPIGQGKFATVYKAETKDNKVVALKKIKIFEMNDVKLRDKCLKEVKLMQQLDHPTIIKYLDSFISNNELIIVTEWAEKGDLKKLLKNAQQSDNPLTESQVWEFVLQIAQALQHMHEKRIMHRDLKPANIFITQEDTLKLGDFGLGRVFSEETIEAYSKVGTPLYMSPELLIGEGYDMKSDVWSLGCIAYEMCEMKSPFRNDNEKMSLMDLFNNITKGEYKPVSEKYSENLRRMIQNMIVVDPSKRCDIGKVIEVCTAYKEEQQKAPKIDCYLLMEDIAEKLCLVEYQKKFCYDQNKTPIHRLYFALQETNVKSQEKFMHFVEIAYWLMNLIQGKTKTTKKGSGLTFNVYALHDEIANKLLDDVKSLGVVLPPNITGNTLKAGIGDGICHILNELLTKELVALNYKFKTADFAKMIQHDETNDYIEINDDVVQKEEIARHQIVADANDSDEEVANEKADEKHNQGTLGPSSRNSSNSTCATDADLKVNKKYFGTTENGLQIVEQYIEIDPVEWAKEMDRVGSQLSELTHNLDKMDYKSISKDVILDEEFIVHIAGIKKHQKELNKSTGELREKRYYKKMDEWQAACESIKKGEKNINEACYHLNDNLKTLVEEKKTIYAQLQQCTESMKEKIASFDKINKETHKITTEIKEKEDFVLGDNKINKLKQTIQSLKLEMTEMDTRTGIMRTLEMEILKREKKDNNNRNIHHNDKQSGLTHFSDEDEIK